jgi:hypothetical protein
MHTVHVSRVVCGLALAFLACDTTAASSDDIDSASRADVAEVARFGSRDDVDRGFSQIGSVDVDSRGNVYALDGMAYQIRVFAPNGQFLRSIGGRGGGPGEWEGYPRFGIQGDTLWTYDFPPGRITVFSLDGTPVESGRTVGWPARLRNSTVYLTPFAMRSDGNLVTWFGRRGYNRGDQAEATPTTIARVVFDLRGNVVDTAGFLSAPPPRLMPPEGYDRGRYQKVSVGGQSYMVPDPPTELPDWLPFDSGYVVVEAETATSATGSFTVTRIGVSGDTQFHRVLRYRAEPYTEELLRQRAQRQPFVSRNGQVVSTAMGEEAIRAVRDKMRFPEYQLPLETAWISNDESVWLSRPTSGQSRKWFVLSSEGHLKGIVELPSLARPLWNRGDTLYASVPDEADVPWLIRYRVRF